MKLTKNELEIMEVLWNKGEPLTSADITRLSVDKSWKDSSIHILINSLLQKKAIYEAGYTRTGKGYGRTFAPTEVGEAYYADYLASIAQRTSIPMVFASLINSKGISEATIDELEQMLEAKRQELD